MNGLAIVSLISSSLFFMLGFFVLSEGLKARKAFFWLALFFLAIGLNFLDGGLLFLGFYHTHSVLMLWEDPFLFLLGPFTYFFARGIRTNRVWQPVMSLHFIPFLLTLAGVVYFHISSTNQERVQFLETISSIELSWQTMYGFVPSFGHVLVYVLTSRKMLKEATKELKQYYSTAEIDWALDAVNLLFFLVLMAIGSTITRLFPFPNLQVFALSTVVIASIFIISRLLSKGMRRPIFVPRSNPDNTFTLAPEVSAELLKKIEQRMLDEELFKNPNLTLKELADTINESERAVSFTINKVKGTNFFDYVNDFRIKSATQLLIDPTDPKTTVLEIMYEVGFNSKSSFNTQFKRKTGLSPSAYRKTNI